MTEYVDPHCAPKKATPPPTSDLAEDPFPTHEDTGPSYITVGELFHHLNWIRADDGLDSLKANMPWANWEYAGPVGSRSIVGDLSPMREFGAGFVISKGDDPRTHSVSLAIGFNSFPEFTKTMRSVCAAGRFVSDPPSYLAAASAERGQTGFELEHSWWQSIGHLYEVRGEVRSNVFKPTDDSEVTCFLTVTKYF
jgi:hypothetical protein